MGLATVVLVSSKMSPATAIGIAVDALLESGIGLAATQR